MFSQNFALFWKKAIKDPDVDNWQATATRLLLQVTYPSAPICSVSGLGAKAPLWYIGIYIGICKEFVYKIIPWIYKKFINLVHGLIKTSSLEVRPIFWRFFLRIWLFFEKKAIKDPDVDNWQATATRLLLQVTYPSAPICSVSGLGAKAPLWYIGIYIGICKEFVYKIIPWIYNKIH